MFKKLLKFIYMIIFKSLDYIYPKNSKLVVFSQANNRYSDNSRELFKSMCHNDYYKAVWLVDNKKTETKILKDLPGAKIVFRYTLQGLCLTLSSKYVILSHGFGDMKLYSYVSSNTHVIMLWHAITLKNVGILDKKYDLTTINKLISNESSRYSLLISSSSVDKFMISGCFGIDARKALVTGLPRNDRYLSSLLKKDFDFINSQIELKIPINILIKKIILYAPTFRDFGITEFFPFEDFNIDVLVDKLIEEDTCLLIRPHQNDFKNQERIKTLADNGSGHILVAGNKEVPDVAELLPFVDIVITDYSSIYIDLLLKDVPPIFIPYDLEEYERVRGLAYDYELITPGPKVFTQKDFIVAIEDAFKSAPKYKEQRIFVKKMFHKYDDGKACERIAQAMKELI